MLFWIDTQGFDVAEVVRDNIESFETLGCAAFARYHAVLGSRELFRALAGSSAFSKRASAYYRYAYSQYAQLAIIRNHIDEVKIHVSDLANSAQKFRPALLREFEHIESCGRSYLLVEHVFDYRVVAGFARAFLSDIGLGRLGNIALTFAAGGGGGTGHVLAVYQTDGYSLGCCVVDSDRQNIESRVGGTADFCIENYIPTWRWNLHIIDGRELENLIPDAVLRDAVHTEVRALADFSNDNTWAISGFVDHKKSDVLCRFLDSAPLSAPVEAALKIFSGSGSAITQCCHVKRCASGGVRCSLTTGNAGILEAVANLLETRALPRKSKMTSSFVNLLRDVVRAGFCLRMQPV